MIHMWVFFFEKKNGDDYAKFYVTDQKFEIMEVPFEIYFKAYLT